MLVTHAPFSRSSCPFARYLKGPSRRAPDCAQAVLAESCALRLTYAPFSRSLCPSARHMGEPQQSRVKYTLHNLSILADSCHCPVTYAPPSINSTPVCMIPGRALIWQGTHCASAKPWIPNPQYYPRKPWHCAPTAWSLTSWPRGVHCVPKDGCQWPIMTRGSC